MATEKAKSARPWLVLAGGDFAYKGIMAIYWVLLARQMGTDDLGVLALANAIAMPAYAILDAGLTTHLIKDYSDTGGLMPRHRGRVRKRLSLALLLPLPLAGLAWILGGGFTAGLATILMCLAYCSDFSGQIMLAPARSASRMEPDAAVRMIQSVGAVILSVALLANGLNSPVWIALASTVSYGFAIYPPLRIWRRSHGWSSFSEDIQPESREEMAITQGTIALTAFSRLDSLLVQALLGSVALATYTVAFKLVEVARLLPGAVSRIVLSHSSEEGPEQYSLRKHLKTSIILGAVGALGLIVAGPFLLGLLFGDKYMDLAGPTIRIIGLSIIPFSVMISACMYAVGSGRAGVMRKVMIEGVIVLVAAMVALGELFDLEGAAIGMLIAQVFVAARFWPFLSLRLANPSIEDTPVAKLD